MIRRLRTARGRAVLVFVLAGLVCGTFTVRLPALADRLGMAESEVSAVLLAWGLGALLAMQAMRGLLARAGSAAVLRVAGPLSAVALLGVAFAPAPGWAVGAAAVFGMLFGAVDVAMNAQGSVVERAARRPLMNGLHAGWCVGAMAAGLLGAGLIALGVPYPAHLAIVAAGSVPAFVLIGRGLLPDPATDPAQNAGPARRRMPLLVYLLGAIAFCAFMVEGAVADWNGLFLRRTIGAPEAVAALGYPVFEAGMLAARLTGDRLRTRWGARRLMIASGLGTAATFTVVITSSSAVVAVTGMVLVGLAVAMVSPMAMSLAGTATSTPGPAIAQTGAMGYAGLLLGPVVIGFLSHAASLRVALGIAVVLGVVIALAARLLPVTASPLDHPPLPRPIRPVGGPRPRRRGAPARPAGRAGDTRRLPAGARIRRAARIARPAGTDSRGS
ncbi:MFS transporter [Sphaerisporangium rufum]|uniref:MFS transporter n=1 Tax=Sphaerisporangium rufum TaxID=1381558 RepID=A0A919V286_9ACTN|nr:MFS transporter [Sphaerisporangium rufum]GII79437.1 MFS transporter [Sphaerisporangium rufum]